MMVAHTLKSLSNLYLTQVPSKMGVVFFTCYHMIIIQQKYSKSASYYTFLLILTNIKCLQEVSIYTINMP